MTKLDSGSVVAVIGAGTMGAGIAQVAATAGHPVMLLDVAPGAAQKGLDSVRTGLDKLVSRGKKSQQEIDDLCARITPTNAISSLSQAAIVIEAIVENVDIKRKVFAELESICSSETIIASNTSSISISALAAELEHPQRLVGMHFFNPAAVLKLVEVVSGLQTSDNVANTVFATAQAWGKTPVHAKSTPGFIVNRIARPFYSEGFRSLYEQAANAQTIDGLMRGAGGFRMGPFQLTDLIGQDINNAVSESVYAAYYGDKRFQPSVMQAEMVAGGLLGRKSGRGFFDYSLEQLPEPDYLPSDVEPYSGEVEVYGDLGVARELLEMIENSDLNVSQHASQQSYIQLGTTRLQLSEGNTASQTAAELGHAELVLFDLARSYSSCECIAVAMACQANEHSLVHVNAFFTKLGKRVVLVKDVPGLIVQRTVCMLVNEAADAVNQGVCAPDDVDTAMKLGLNYPEGPLEWGARLGYAWVVEVLTNLQSSYGEERYRCSPWLKVEQYRDAS